MLGTLSELATKFLLPFNKLKKLPANIDALINLRYVDMRSNLMTGIPGTFFKIPNLEYVSAKTLFKGSKFWSPKPH